MTLTSEVTTAPGRAGQVGLLLLAWVTAVISAAQLSWVSTGRLLPWLCLALAAVAVIAVARLAFSQRIQGQTLVAVAWTFAGLSASTALSGVIHDFSYDGQQYHQQAVMAMLDGWNPLRDEPVTGDYALWINGYAKGVWTYAAVITGALGWIEWGKSINLVLALAGGLIAYEALNRAMQLPVGQAAVVAGLAAASPILATQWPTYTNDNAIGSTMLILAGSMAGLLRSPEGHRKWALWSAGLALAFLTTTKSSGVAYGILISGLGVIIVHFLGGVALTRRWIAVSTCSLLAGVVLLAFNPYVTNSWRHGHPLYPLAGTEKVDIISGNSPQGIQELGRSAQLFGSLFSRSHSEFDPEGSLETPPAIQLKVPGHVQLGELRPFMTKNDVRIAGFGPWFSLALVLAFVLLVALLTRRDLARKARWAAALGPLSVFALAWIFPEPWWARYVPQLWLGPLMVVTAVWLLDSRAWMRWAAAGTAAVLAANTLALYALFAAGTGLRELDLRAQLESLARISRTGTPIAVQLGLTPSTALKLDRAGVSWQPMPDDACPGWTPLHYTGSRVCLNPEQLRQHRIESEWTRRLKSALLGA